MTPWTIITLCLSHLAIIILTAAYSPRWFFPVFFLSSVYVSLVLLWSLCRDKREQRRRDRLRTGVRE